MKRYFSHLIILPNSTQLEDFIVEIYDEKFYYYPFTGELHSTTYLECPILLSFREDLEGKTLSLNQLNWALQGSDPTKITLYAYSLTPCSSCLGNRYIASKLP